MLDMEDIRGYLNIPDKICAAEHTPGMPDFPRAVYIYRVSTLPERFHEEFCYDFQPSLVRGVCRGNNGNFHFLRISPTFYILP